VGDVCEILHTPLKDQDNFLCVSGQTASTGSGLSNPAMDDGEYPVGRYRTEPDHGGTPMARRIKAPSDPEVLPMLTDESIYIGVDSGKFQNVAGFLSRTL
jgi:hypothetical protein